jgi:hypothetical protein
MGALGLRATSTPLASSVSTHMVSTGHVLVLFGSTDGLCGCAEGLCWCSAAQACCLRRCMGEPSLPCMYAWCDPCCAVVCCAGAVWEVFTGQQAYRKLLDAEHLYEVRQRRWTGVQQTNSPAGL